MEVEDTLGLDYASDTRIRNESFNVLPVHAEVEGISFLSTLEELLILALEKGFRTVILEKITGMALKGSPPVLPLALCGIPGRAGKVLVPKGYSPDPFSPS